MGDLSPQGESGLLDDGGDDRRAATAPGTAA